MAPHNIQKKECVVIGAGVIGVLTAYNLTHSGYSVTLIDKAEPGRGCSYGNAGHFATAQIFPLPSPDLLRQLPALLLNPDSPLTVKPSYLLTFLPWAFSFLKQCRKAPFEKGTAALKKLNHTALEDWKEVLKATGLEKYLTHRGTIEVFKSSKGLIHGTSALNDFTRHEIPVCQLSRAELCRMVPAITPDQQGGLFFPETAHSINPFGMVQEIYKKFREMGGNFISAQVLEIQKKSPDNIQILTTEQLLSAGKVFICAGLESKTLVKSLGYHVPLTAERGYHIMLPRPEIDLDYALTYHERKFIITPMEDGIRLAGTVEFAHKDSSPNYARARILKNFAREILPGLSRHSTEEWMGCRPTLPDYLPIIDRQDNTYFAFGHNHLGLTQAATTAKILTRMMQDQPSANEPNPFRITRF